MLNILLLFSALTTQSLLAQSLLAQSLLAQSPPTQSLSFCASFKIAQRTGSASCWARYTIQEGQWLCIPHSLWSSWIRHPTPLCGIWEGRWKAFSPPENSVEKTEKKQFLKFVVTHHPTLIAQTAPFPWFHPFERLREIGSAILAPHDPSGVARSLFFGQKKPEGTGSLLIRLGFVHVLNATGIHLYAMARLWSALLRELTLWTGLSTRNGLIASRLISFLGVGFAWLVGGARWGMLRPWILVSLRGMARQAGFRWTASSPLTLALGLDAAALIGLSIKNGSWSFFCAQARGSLTYALAVGGGIIALSRSEHSSRASHWNAHLRLAFGSWIFVAVLEVLHSQSIALTTPLLSLITLPIFASLIYPLFIFLSLTLSWHSSWKWFLHASSLAIENGIRLLNTLNFHLPSIWFVEGRLVFFALFLGALALSLKRRALQLLLLMCVVFIRIFGFMPVPSSLQLTIEQLDVGQGDAALIRDPLKGAGLIDTGSARSLNEAKWWELLSERNIHSLDWILLTHLDEDHAGGLLQIARNFKIRCVSAPRDQWDSPRGSRLITALADWKIPRVNAESGRCVPYPTTVVSESKRSGNSTMAAIFISWGKNFYFNAGDAGNHQEEQLMRWAEPWLTSQIFDQRILKISHHGSRFSSSETFLNAIQPTKAWISAGLGNHYGHPALEVLNRLLKRGLPIHRTDQEGRIREEGDPHR